MPVGHWAHCEISKDHHGLKMYFWKTPGYPHDFCHLCLYSIQKKNGTLCQSPGMRKTRKKESKPTEDYL